MEEIIVIILGLIIGSFMNVLIYRLPLEKSIVSPGSSCPKCSKPVKFYDNIPVLSYIILMGKCRNCKTHISIIYPLVEAFTAFTFWLTYYFFGHLPVHAGFTMLFLVVIIVLAFIDFEHQILPDELTLGGAVVFLVYAFFNPIIPTLNAIIASLSSALFFTGLYYFYVKVRKMEGLGQGDIKMMLLLGAFLGIQNLVVAVMVASFSGLFVGLFIMITKGKTLKSKLPFGTFLSLGSYVAIFWGDAIMIWFRNLYV